MNEGRNPLSATLVRQTDFNLTIEQCVASHTNITCAILVGHKTLSNAETEGYLLSLPVYVLSHCPPTAPPVAQGLDEHPSGPILESLSVQSLMSLDGWVGLFVSQAGCLSAVWWVSQCVRSFSDEWVDWR